MAFFKILLLLCLLCTAVHCLPAGRSEATQGAKGICSQFYKPRGGITAWCLICTGFDPSCFTTSTTTPPTTTTSTSTTTTTTTHKPPPPTKATESPE
ncbi:uncharacterized protein LOC126373905 [Pectinophora gossypiella]|uniref:uncharacterized protein LOC126373905 n=1 Tax=Pectinophora gossypiella TaxID=13191 RepID=UPI00214EED85|nr:uncharacterized protein LOC126373905 [Pectinophora gossypiella]